MTSNAERKCRRRLDYLLCLKGSHNTHCLARCGYTGPVPRPKTRKERAIRGSYRRLKETPTTRFGKVKWSCSYWRLGVVLWNSWSHRPYGVFTTKLRAIRFHGTASSLAPLHPTNFRSAKRTCFHLCMYATNHRFLSLASS